MAEEESRGFSSAGRTLALQARGHRFESGNLHQGKIEVFGQESEHFNLVLDQKKVIQLRAKPSASGFARKSRSKEMK